VKKNAERFARIDIDLSDFEKERTQCHWRWKTCTRNKAHL